MRRFYFLTFLIFIFYFLSCKSKVSDYTQNFESFPLFINKDTIFNNNDIVQSIPTIDRYVSIPKNLPLQSKIKILLDSISIIYFHRLSIEVIGIDSSYDDQKNLTINLKEKSDFKIPESLGSYQTWYDYFQGSTGGLNTTTILRESILQKDYKNDWISGLVVFYQGDSIGIWDHINLDGLIIRN